MNLNISLEDEEVKILNKRAEANLLTLKEQVEDIIRRSCLSYKKNSSYKPVKVDDQLVGVFSREKRGRPKKK